MKNYLKNNNDVLAYAVGLMLIVKICEIHNIEFSMLEKLNKKGLLK